MDAGGERPSGYCVLRMDEERVDVSVVAQRVAEVLGWSRVDAAVALRHRSGFIARGLSEVLARRLVGVLGGMGVRAMVLAEDDLVPLPQPERVRHAVSGPNGLFLRVGTEDLVIPWQQLFLVVVARLGRRGEVVVRKAAPTPIYYLDTHQVRVNYARFFDWTTARRVERWVVDLFLEEPWRRLRVEEGMTDFRYDRDARRPNTRAWLVQFGRELRKWAGGVYLNTGAVLLGEEGINELSWRDLTFENELVFDVYCNWQVQLAVAHRRRMLGESEGETKG